MECGFVPIGAGLKAAPKKKKKKHGKYVEPGSSRGFLMTLFLGFSAYGVYSAKPWEDDWEMVRALFGKGRRHSIVGEWQIMKTVVVNKSKPAVLAQPAIQSGMINFSKQGSVKMVFNGKTEKTTASGTYVVDGQQLAVHGVKSGSQAIGLPASMKMNLSWQGSNDLIAMVGGEAVYMRKKDKGNGWLELMKYGMSAKKGNAEAPGAMKGVISGMQDQLKSASEN